MKNLLTIKEQDVLPDSPVVETSAFTKRGASRAVLLDTKGQVYLLNVSKHGYHKLPDDSLEQTSYCYLAKQVGEQLASALEAGELAEGMFEIKATNIDETIGLLLQDKPDNLEGKFIQKRDLAFLRAAKEQL